MPRVVGSDGTVSIVKIVFLSRCVENLKVKKVIKVSYLNQESRQCSECFFFLFLCIQMLYISEHVLRIRIFVYVVYPYHGYATVQD